MRFVASEFVLSKESAVQKCDIKWLLVVLSLAILFTIFGLPYFSRFGYGLWAVLVYFFLFVAFMYGRRNRPRHPNHHVR